MSTQPDLIRKGLLPLSTTAFRAKNAIVNSAVSPDGRMVATVYYRDGSVHVTSIVSGDLVKVLNRDYKLSRERCIRWSSDGSRLTLFADNLVKTWDTVSWEVTRTSCSAYVTLVTYAFLLPDEQTVISLSYDGWIYLYTADPYKVILRTNTCCTHVSCAALSPDGGTLACSERGCDDAIYLYSAVSGTQIRVIKGRRNFLTWTKDGRFIVSSDVDGICVSDVKSGSVAKQIETSRRSSTNMCFALSPDDSIIVSPFKLFKIGFWCIKSGSLLKLVQWPSAVCFLRSIEWSGDGSAIVLCDDNEDSFAVLHM